MPDAKTRLDQPTGARLIAERLHRAGIRHAFGIPGGEVLALVDALDAVGIAFTLCKHENSGGFMAEGVQNVTGAPALLLATIGPGVSNAVNAVASAWQDRVPMIFLTGRIDPAVEHTYTHQIFDHQAVLRPITKASLLAVDGAVDVVIDKAVSLALSGQPGPVHVDVPIGAAEGPQPLRETRDRPLPAPVRPLPGPDLTAARDCLAAARRPVMIAGVDVVNQGAAQTVTETCRRLRIPLITTYKAKGVLPEDDPLSLGAAGLSPKADRILLPFLADSDCIVLAGYDPVEMRTSWCQPWRADAPVIELSAVAPTHGSHAARWLFVGDVGAGLDALTADLSPLDTWADGQAADTRAALRQAFAPPAGWGPGAVIQTLRTALPRDAIVTVDTGAHRILFCQMWESYAPRTVMQSASLSTMGCALGQAIGAKLAAPERTVASVIGDASLEMVVGELATARDLRLPLILVVLADESLALIELKQRASNRPNVGVDFPGTDFAAVGRAFGGHGVTVDDTETLARELAMARERDTFSLISCRISRRAYDGAF